MVTETEIEVGWVKVKKSYLILQVGKWKSVLTMFCWKKFYLFVIHVNFVFQKLVRRVHLKIFLGVSLGFFFVVVFRFFFLFFFSFFCLFCFVFFFFVPRGKSSVSSLWYFCCFFLFKISCWDVFFILGVHSRVRGSPM